MSIGDLANIIGCKFYRINRLIQPLPDHRHATEQPFDQVRHDVFSHLTQYFEIAEFGQYQNGELNALHFSLDSAASNDLGHNHTARTFQFWYFR